MTIMFDTTQLTPEQHAAAKEEFRIYKTELRGFIRDAELYHISERPDGAHWDGIEYFDPKRKAGVVYAFRGTVENESSHTFVLKGLRPEGMYRLHFQDGSAPDRTMTGKELCSAGVAVKLAVANSSELVFLDEGK
jgi:alpha-galactosidase